MSLFGLLKAISLRLRPTNASANYIEHKAPSGLASNIILTWLASLPASVQALTVDSSGNIGTAEIGGGGGDNITVNGSAVTDVEFDDLTPAPPPGGENVRWQKDSATPNNVSAYLDYGSLMNAIRQKPIWANDFIATSTGNAGSQAFYPFGGLAIPTTTAGTINLTSANTISKNHPGILRARSSSTANSGYLIGTILFTGTNAGNMNMILLGGGEICEFIVQFRTFANTTFRIGFIDTTSVTDCGEGVYFEILPSALGVVTCKAADNNVRTPTPPTLFTASLNTWYRFRVVINPSATQADFAVFNDAGVLQGSANISANIPTASGRETGAGIIGTNSTTTLADLYLLDYMALANTRALTR